MGAPTIINCNLITSFVIVGFTALSLSKWLIKLVTWIKSLILGTSERALIARTQAAGPNTEVSARTFVIPRIIVLNSLIFVSKTEELFILLR